MKINKLMIMAVCLITILITGCQSNKIPNSPSSEIVTTEKTGYERFKEEYESLNSTKREGTNFVYSDIKIPEFKNIKYVNPEEVVDLLSSRKAVIYIGANWCPWCRQIVSSFIDSCKRNNIDTIYYLCLDDYKSYWELDNDGKPTKVIDGTKEYYELLDALSPYLTEYKINDVSTGELRIYQPTILTVLGGKIIDCNVVTQELPEGQTPYDKITDSQCDKFCNLFDGMLSKLKIEHSACDINEVCE